MAAPSDTSLAFFTKATPDQWSYVFSMYKDILRVKAELRKKKGGPEELVKLDTWYQEQLPKLIHSRQGLHILRDELVQIMKWKLMRGKFRPRLIDLVKINTEAAVLATSKKAFRKLPNLSTAITALTNLKGVGPATASAILAAAFPEHAPFMADECMLSTPGVEATDYTLAEYLNYADKIKSCSERLKAKDPEGKWTPHKVELVLWAHYIAKEMKPSLLNSIPVPNAQNEENSPTHNGKSEQHASDDGHKVEAEENSNDEPKDEQTTEEIAEVKEKEVVEDKGEEDQKVPSSEDTTESTENAEAVDSPSESTNHNNVPEEEAGGEQSNDSQENDTDEPASKKPRI